jgi:hypothetical protein
MKVYELYLKPHDQFIVYNREDIWTLVTDEKYPLPPTRSRWDQKTKTFFNVSMPFTDKVITPTYGILIEEFDAFFLHHIPELINYGHDIGWKQDWNILLLRKEWKELGIIEVGFFLRAGITDCVNEELTHLAERYLNLKLFW